MKNKNYEGTIDSLRCNDLRRGRLGTVLFTKKSTEPEINPIIHQYTRYGHINPSTRIKHIQYVQCANKYSLLISLGKN